MHPNDFTKGERAGSSPEPVSPTPEVAASAPMASGVPFPLLQAVRGARTSAGGAEHVGAILERVGLVAPGDGAPVADWLQGQHGEAVVVLRRELVGIDVSGFSRVVEKLMIDFADGARIFARHIDEAFASVSRSSRSGSRAFEQLVAEVRAMSTAEEAKRVRARERSRQAIVEARLLARHAPPAGPHASVLSPPWASSRARGWRHFSRSRR